MNYKDSLNMFTTDFEMRANLKDKEPVFRKFWLDKEVYNKKLQQNKGNESFILHDGPPYANGDLHIGHALNKILKDIIVRYKNLKGFYSPYVPGWDMHGLPIEHKMLQQLNKKHTEIDVVELRKQAAKYAEEQLLIQKAQFQELQMFSDFKEIYRTIDPKFEAEQLRLFKKMALDGLVYKGLKPVYWSTSSLSALAEAEVVYKDKKSPSIYVAYEFNSKNDYINPKDNLVIWTTTPWTVIANSGVAIGVDIDYVKLNHNNQFYVIAKDLVENLVQIFNFESFEIVNKFKGKDLLNLTYKQPFNNTKNHPKIVAADFVDVSSGTGLVHMAPMFGEDDFQIGKINNLEEIMHVDDDGTINKHGAQFVGMNYEDANKEVSNQLEKEGKLIAFKWYKHSYPHDWRTDKPIIFRGTPQWFVDIAKIKEGMLKTIDTVQSYPQWVIKRLSEMIAKRGPWTISRQRSWGVPIPVFYNENDEVINNAEIYDYVIDLVTKQGTDIWFEWTTDQLLPEKYRNKNYKQEKSIMDVWFDSGSTNLGVKIQGQPEDENETPFDMYLEGTDQFRGWFNSSMINSYVFRKKSPYKFLLAHGFVLDGKNEKMSKSKGNVILPSQVINELGADVLRLWVASVEYTSDVSISNEILKQVAEMYRKIRNTIRFMLSNIVEFEYDSKLELTKLNKLMFLRLESLKAKVSNAFENYNFNLAVKLINNFIVDLSGYYLSYSKDILYADSLKSNSRLQIQTVIYLILDYLLVALSPILPTTTEEAFQVFNKTNKAESVHLQSWMDAEENNEDLEGSWKSFFEAKETVYKLIEEKIAAKEIKRANEATIYMPKLDLDLSEAELAQMLIVSKVVFSDNFEVVLESTIKCPRCWNHHQDQNEDSLCNRCSSVVKHA
ncbi:isoleucyl-tRNA synthetase [Mycoplasma testudineum]|uniref:Isoleucine--tRNA ligase n=1 Tax=Mycoplasma testudineum TaxID=244584 RepID=A0A4R6IHS3_9MOLU|nr:isoleucine--tRNA ligase [Mycoplasma testudineum]OYD27177.1 isoleucine--tRNA ligase [Mycoplasma testudineum]TDO21065.1 isoleucyl-tRNA synthetase [Mycoplasma testudineum]